MSYHLNLTPPEGFDPPETKMLGSPLSISNKNPIYSQLLLNCDLKKLFHAFFLFYCKKNLFLFCPVIIAFNLHSSKKLRKIQQIH